MRSHLISAALLACLAVPSVVHAQSLVDVARAEEARRKAVKTPAKVYTNDDLLRPGEVAPASSASSTPASAGAKPADAAKAEPAKPAAPPSTGKPAKDAEYWEGRLTVARQAADPDN